MKGEDREELEHVKGLGRESGLGSGKIRWELELGSCCVRFPNFRNLIRDLASPQADVVVAFGKPGFGTLHCFVGRFSNSPASFVFGWYKYRGFFFCILVVVWESRLWCDVQYVVDVASAARHGCEEGVSVSMDRSRFARCFFRMLLFGICGTVS